MTRGSSSFVRSREVRATTERLRAVAYSLCKSVRAWEGRDEFSEVIRSLTISTGQPMSPDDRSMFGYVARQQHAQVAGYLATDQYRDRLAGQPFGPPPPLVEHERKLLAGVHAEFLRLNDTCIDRVFAAGHSARAILDPYNSLAPVSVAEAAPAAMFNEETVHLVADAFELHPGLAVVQGLNVPDGAEDAERMLEATHVLERHLQQAGPLETPDDIFRVMVEHDTPQRQMMKVVAAFMNLRAALGVLDQLVYQAMLRDRLPALSPDNTIAVDKAVHHAAGGGWQLLCLHDEATAHMECGGLALLSGLPGVVDTSQLASISRITTSMGGDIGPTLELELREIDENLSPYGGLLSRA